MRIGSLCSGYGGLDMGVQLAIGGSVAWHVEYDPDPSKILTHHWPSVPNHGDVKTTDWAGVEPVSVLTAGYPCQPFSHAGNREGSDDPRHLWPDVARAIGCLRPRLVVLENVRGHVSLGLDAVIGDLSRLGYDSRWGVVRASDAGAPHGRARIFIVATDADQPGLEGAQPARGRIMPSRGTAADPHGLRHQRSRGARGRRPGPADLQDDLPQVVTTAQDWGIYADAIARWEALTRPAPAPTQPSKKGTPQLSPAFSEWLMGLPAGHVTGVPGLSRNAQLKALGNGVVPQQAALALTYLLAAQEVAA